MSEARSLFLGADDAYVEAQMQAAAGDGVELFALCQRIIWGLFLRPRVQIDVDAAVEQLMQGHAEDFVAQLLTSMVRRTQGRDAEADAHLARSRALLVPEHPWAGLMPSLEPQPADRVREVHAGRVYCLDGAVEMSNLAPFTNGNTATLIRTADGGLTLINPVPMDAVAVEQMRELGDVRHIVAPTAHHYTQVARAKELFPGARVHGVPGHRGNPECSMDLFDDVLDDERPLFPGEIDQFTLEGCQVGDVLLLDRETRTLMVHDNIFVCILDHLPPVHELSAFGSLYVWAWGTWGRVALPAYQPLLWNDLPRYQACMRRVLDQEIDNLGSSHGGFDLVMGDAGERLRSSLSWFLEVDQARHGALFTSFAERQPELMAQLSRASR